MTKDELVSEYKDGKVLDNQFELGMFVHEQSLRMGNEKLRNDYPIKAVSKNKELYYDIAELSLKKGAAFFNDGYYIIEDLNDLKNLSLSSN